VGGKKDILNIIMLIACSMMCHDSVEKNAKREKEHLMRVICIIHDLSKLFFLLLLMIFFFSI
jgi:hypothetical protein